MKAKRSLAVLLVLALVLQFGGLTSMAQAAWEESPAQESQDETFESEAFGELLPGVAELLESGQMAPPAAQEPGMLEEPEDISDFIDLTASIWIGGKEYTSANPPEHIDATTGSSFAYRFTWQVKANPLTHLANESYFTKRIFAVPGLNLNGTLNQSLVVGGLNIGQWSRTYDRTTGEMNFTVQFNQYAAFFSAPSVGGFMKGSCSFGNSAIEDGEFILGDHTGTIDVTKPDPIPPKPPITGGVGWQPAKPPEFPDRDYLFGKGLKWNSSSNGSDERNIMDWRAVYLEYLQQVQEDWLADGELPEMDRYCIVEDTLDENQQFYFYKMNSQDEYTEGTPFYVELPIMVPGSGVILNQATGGVGNGSYDGPGKIAQHISGDAFTKLESREDVLTTPMSWTVSEDKRVLTINLGKLGTTDPEEGLVLAPGAYCDCSYDMRSWADWQGRLNTAIADCEAKIAGQDSPLALLELRVETLHNEVEKLLALPVNADADPDGAIHAFFEGYHSWKPGLNGGYFTETLPEGIPTPEELAALLGHLKTGSGASLTEQKVYLDLAKSLEDLSGDQAAFLETFPAYEAAWLEAKAAYENTRDFYSQGRIYGFVLKYATQATNTMATQFSNRIVLSLGDNRQEDQDEAKIQWSSGATGNYRVGSAVVQKQDSGSGNPLAGAVFNLYCGNDEDPDDTSGVGNHDYMAHFYDKEASAGGDTYFFTHKGEHTDGNAAGDFSDLVVNPDGRLIMSYLTDNHVHWLVEKTAPQGYYLDPTPQKLENSVSSVLTMDFKNVVRAVQLKKTDSFSGYGVQGAEFALYKVVDGVPTHVTGFRVQTVDGETIYRYDGKTTAQKLLTGEDGYLYVHGLDAGDYYLVETKAAPGYEPLPANQEQPHYSFTLAEELPQGVDPEDGFYRMDATPDGPVQNAPVKGALAFTKAAYPEVGFLEGGDATTPLAGAEFALYRWNGPESQWDDHTHIDTDDMVQVTMNQEGYFITGNTNADRTRLVSGVDGGITLANIPLGHYYLLETKAPEGYTLDATPLYFNVTAENYDQPICLYHGHAESQPVVGNVVYNVSHPLSLALWKTAAGSEDQIIGEPVADGGWKLQGAQVPTTGGLEGATYKLFRQMDGEIHLNQEELAATELLPTSETHGDPAFAVGQTGKDGLLRLSDMSGRADTQFNGTVVPGIYYLVEVAAPKGYVLDQTPIVFDLREPGAFTVAGGTGNAGIIKQAVNTPVVYGLEVLKTDGTSKAPLSGVTFQLWESSGTEPLRFTAVTAPGGYSVYRLDPNGSEVDLLTDKNGTLRVAGLTPGASYVLHEAPLPGYLGLPDQEIKVEPDGDQTTPEGVLYKEVHLENQRKPLDIQLVKRDAQDETIVLAGAEFALLRYELTLGENNVPHYGNQEVIATATTGADGVARFIDVPWAEDPPAGSDFLDYAYFLTETKAPEGYLLNTTSIPVDLDGSTKEDPEDPSRLLLSFHSVPNIKKAEETGKLELTKVDKADHSLKLEGAHFQLEVQKDGAWVAFSDAAYVTDSEGRIALTLPLGTYRVMEITPPPGYQVDDPNWRIFTVEKGQVVELTFENTKVPDPGVNPDPPGPVDPDKPGPVDPDNPGPVEPDKPGPVDPDKPGPVEPGNPSPTDPGSPDGPGDSGGPGETPGTSDGTEFVDGTPPTLPQTGTMTARSLQLLGALAMLGSLLCAAGAILSLRRKAR